MHERPDDGCLVRVEHRMLADNDQWDGYLNDAESGWPEFFEKLKAYLN